MQWQPSSIIRRPPPTMIIRIMCAAYKRIAPNTSLEHWHTQWCAAAAGWCWRTCAWRRERVRCVRSRLLLHHLPNARTIHAHNKPPAPKRRRRRRDLIQSAYTSADGLIFFVFSCKTKKQELFKRNGPKYCPFVARQSSTWEHICFL